MAHEVETRIISDAVRDLGRRIVSDDGIANAACFEAADRLDHLDALNKGEYICIKCGLRQSSNEDNEHNF